MPGKLFDKRTLDAQRSTPRHFLVFVDKARSGHGDSPKSALVAFAIFPEDKEDRLYTYAKEKGLSFVIRVGDIEDYRQTKTTHGDTLTVHDYASNPRMYGLRVAGW